MNRGTKNSHRGIIRVVFPNKLLFSRPALLDPKNLETTQEYYLLENLAGTLIRDSIQAELKFEGALAESWDIKGHTLTFTLKNNLKWSDGSPLSCDEISEHFKRLIRSEARHLQYLKVARSVSCDSAQNTLLFEFKRPVPPSVLHEFSLADSAVIKLDSNGFPRWDVTSGFYFVASLDKSALRIVLEKNPHSQGFPTHAPTTVILKEIADKSNLKELFSDTVGWESGLDLFAPQGWNFNPETVKLLSESSLKLEGQPTIIHFIYFIKGERETRDQVRAALKSSESINRAPPQFLKPFSQMIPKGYSGHLEHNPENGSIKQLKPMRVLLTARPSYKVLEPYLEKVAEEFRKNQVELTYVFENYGTLPDLSPYDAVMGLSLFKGNMHDPLGSWSFLADKEHGPLKYYHEQIDPYFKKATSTESDSEKRTILRQLHQSTLENSLLIPLWIEPMFFIFSSRIQPTRSNPFDLRIRFFELDLTDANY